jgi:glycosyltransferase involved in cell wall biosynthesis
MLQPLDDADPRIVDAPMVSVIVPVFDDQERLVRCLEALERQSYPDTAYEIVVVDNGSKQPLRSEGICSRVRTIIEPRPGAYAARNTGIRAAVGSVLAFTDSDCIPAETWLEAAVIRLLMLPSPGMVGGRLEVFPRDAERPTIAELYDETFWMRQRQYVQRAGFAATANLVVHRSVFERVGLFDPELKSGGDREWGQRARASGVIQEYAPEALVRHPARRTVREVLQKLRRTEGGHVQRLLRCGYGVGDVIRDFRADVSGGQIMWRAFAARGDRPSFRLRVAMAFLIALGQLARAIERVRVLAGGAPHRQ